MVWKKGQSGNPKGSRKGRRDERLAYMTSNDQALQKKVVDMAIDGDMRALKIIADRLWPRLRAESRPIAIDPKSGDLLQQGRALIDKALEGELPANLLLEMLKALHAQASLEEMVMLEQRIRTLEEQVDEPPPWLDPQPELPGAPKQKLPMRSKRRRRGDR